MTKQTLNEEAVGLLPNDQLRNRFTNNQSYGSVYDRGSSSVSQTAQQTQAAKASQKRTKLLIENKLLTLHGVQQQVDLLAFGKRFLVLGENFQCRMFSQCKDMLQHLKRESIKTDDSRELTFKQPVWIDIQGASPSDIVMMQKDFYFHPLTTEDIQSKDYFEKWEAFEGYIYVVFIGPTANENLLDTSIYDEKGGGTWVGSRHKKETLLHILVFGSFVVTIHEKPMRGIDVLLNRIESEFETSSAVKKFKDTQKFQKTAMMTPSTSRISLRSVKSESNLVSHHQEKKEEVYTSIPSPDWILYACLDVFVDLYIPPVEFVNLEADQIDEAILGIKKFINSDILQRIGVCSRNIGTLRRLLVPKYSMTAHILSVNSNHVNFSENVRVYMRDVLDHLQRCIDRLETARKNLNQTHANFVTKFQLEVAKSGEKTKSLTNQITIFASIWGPVSFISGFFGMNAKTPGEAVPSLDWFYGIVASSLILTLVMVIYFRKELITLKSTKPKVSDKKKTV